jgi:hypothetical protein
MRILQIVLRLSRGRHQTFGQSPFRDGRKLAAAIMRALVAIFSYRAGIMPLYSTNLPPFHVKHSRIS